jgi:HAD superfamily hydrolase (TIGR01509 family)
VIGAVVFDLDGVLLDSEHVWDEARRALVARHGGRWPPEATADMQGMSSVEWSAYIHDRLGVDLDAGRISDLVVGHVLDRYEHDLPLLPGALDAVRRIGGRWPLAVASSANRVVIDKVLAVTGLVPLFPVVVSSEEVPRGKPAPDVYLEAARRLGQPAWACAAVEDSANGIRSAGAAGMQVVAVPNREFPPPAEVLARAVLVVAGVGELTTEALASIGSPPGPETR